MAHENRFAKEQLLSTSTTFRGSLLKMKKSCLADSSLWDPPWMAISVKKIVFIFFYEFFSTSKNDMKISHKP